MFVDGDPYGVSNIYRTLKVGSGNAAQQQALAKHGLNYVIDNYFPEKLKHPERFLP